MFYYFFRVVIKIYSLLVLNNREREREETTAKNRETAKKGLNQKKKYFKIELIKRKFGIKESFVAFEEFRSVYV